MSPAAKQAAVGWSLSEFSRIHGNGDSVTWWRRRAFHAGTPRTRQIFCHVFHVEHGMSPAAKQAAVGWSLCEVFEGIRGNRDSVAWRPYGRSTGTTCLRIFKDFCVRRCPFYPEYLRGLHRVTSSVRLPTKIKRRSDCGIATGSFQYQSLLARASSRSRPPIQSITVRAPIFSDAAHFRKCPNSPTAREHTTSSGVISSSSSS